MSYSSEKLSRSDMRAFIVYIKENDRSYELTCDLDSLGIPYTKVLSLSRFNEEFELTEMHLGKDLYNLTIGRNLLLSEIGAHVGHQRARSAFLDSGYKLGLIMDDDARLGVSPFRLLEKLPQDFAFCLSLSKNIDGIPKLLKKYNEFQALHVPSTMSAHAYVLDRNAARVLEQHYERYGITSVADWPYPLPRIKFYISKENNFVQANATNGYSVAEERDLIRTQGTDHAQSMPISFRGLFGRMKNPRKYGFTYRDLFRQELILRYRTRRLLAILKVRRPLIQLVSRNK